MGITRDAFLFPIKGGKPPKNKPADLTDISLAELKAADELLKEEVANFDEGEGEAVSSGPLQLALNDMDLAYLPSTKRYLEKGMMKKPDRVEAAKHAFEVAEATIAKESKRCKKIEEKCDRVLGGFMMKTKQSFKKIAALAEEKETVAVETEVFRTLSAREERAIESRCEELRQAVEREKDRNSKLQQRYKEMKRIGQLIDQRLQ